MTVATNPRMTLEEYLNYDDGTDTRYELVEGVLVEMGAETDENNLIGMFLISILLEFVPYYRLRRGTEIAVSGSHATSRIPDLMVLSEDGATLPARQRSIVTSDLPAPTLVVEVVSPGEPGEKNYDRDYIEKRQEYAARGIPEYWLIDPHHQVVLVLSLQENSYQEQRFTGTMEIVSPAFPSLQLTADLVLNAGR